MFLYNLKLNGNRLIKFFFIVMLIIILLIFSFGIYQIFFKKQNIDNENVLSITDTINTDKVFEITPENYTNILKSVNENIDSYINCNVHFVGYVYRLIDFDENEFVLARDMLIDENTNQSLVVGFFCTSKDVKSFEDGTWVEVTGTIKKGNYYGELAKIEVRTILSCDEPENKYVFPPTDTYIPTTNMF